MAELKSGRMNGMFMIFLSLEDIDLTVLKILITKSVQKMAESTE